jgi:hypothetical protein
LPSDSTFLLRLAQLDVPGYEILLRDWIAPQHCAAEQLDTLVYDGKTLRGSAALNASGEAPNSWAPAQSSASKS